MRPTAPQRSQIPPVQGGITMSSMPSDELIRVGPGARGWCIRAEWAAALSAPGSWQGTLQRAVLALFLGHDDEGTIPTNGNFLWYELEGLGVVDKMKRRGRPGVKRGHDQDLTDAQTRLHERGIILWNWVTDETRLVYRYTGYPSIGEGCSPGSTRPSWTAGTAMTRRSCSPSLGR
jgi:hypothetical protein